MSPQDDPAAACPVDHKAREAWLAQARAQSTNAPSNPHITPSQAPPASAQLTQTSCDSSTMDQSLTTQPAPSFSHRTLGTSREVSTIPRALPTSPHPHAPSARPANSERDTAPDKTTGNWIYPSERMFFDAMRRKSFSPTETDMSTIVPIHNAVNERAWHEIKTWEAGRGAESCGGPRLESFSGLSTSLTPRARWKSWMGYTKPFDRHDWVVDRCGVKVEYVIDFYAGKAEKGKGEGLNFHLDVRPKLNNFEGWRMRVERYWGF